MELLTEFQKSFRKTLVESVNKPVRFKHGTSEQLYEKLHGEKEVVSTDSGALIESQGEAKGLLESLMPDDLSLVEQVFASINVDMKDKPEIEILERVVRTIPDMLPEYADKVRQMLIRTLNLKG